MAEAPQGLWSHPLMVCGPWGGLVAAGL